MKLRNVDLDDIPIEIMYKFLLRDYRALQAENKELKNDVRRLLEVRTDEISLDDEVVFHSLMKKYKGWNRRKLIVEVEYLLRELKRLTPNEG